MNQLVFKPKRSVSIRNLPIYPNGERLEFLHICANIFVLEFLLTCTKKVHIAIRNLRIYANGERLDFVTFAVKYFGSDCTRS